MNAFVNRLKQLLGLSHVSLADFVLFLTPAFLQHLLPESLQHKTTKIVRHTIPQMFKLVELQELAGKYYWLNNFVEGIVQIDNFLWMVADRDRVWISEGEIQNKLFERIPVRFRITEDSEYEFYAMHEGEEFIVIRKPYYSDKFEYCNIQSTLNERKEKALAAELKAKIFASLKQQY